jgi:hypothetical protein
MIRRLTDRLIYSSHDKKTGWWKSTDFAVLDFNRLMEKWISTEKKNSNAIKWNSTDLVHFGIEQTKFE